MTPRHPDRRRQDLTRLPQERGLVPPLVSLRGAPRQGGEGPLRGVPSPRSSKGACVAEPCPWTVPTPCQPVCRLPHPASRYPPPGERRPWTNVPYTVEAKMPSLKGLQADGGRAGQEGGMMGDPEQ